MKFKKGDLVTSYLHGDGYVKEVEGSVMNKEQATNLLDVLKEKASVKVVKNGTHGYYDVFTGFGWKNHRKIRMVKGEVVALIEGKPMPEALKLEVVNAIKNGNTSFISKHSQQLVRQAILNKGVSNA